MIQISNLDFSYSRKRGNVLTDLSLTIHEGGIYGLLGPNGSGKSTLLNLIMGSLTPKRGEVLLDDINTRHRLPATLSQMFIVPEEVSLPPISLEKFIDNMRPFYPNFDQDILDDSLKNFEIENPGRLDSLSMGQKKKIYISFAMACNTKLLLMDEPTNGLDIPGKVAFRRLCAEQMSDLRTIIISTHQVRDLDSMLDHILILNSQNLCFEANMAQLQRRLQFEHGVSRSMADSALCSIPSPGGYDIMVPAVDDSSDSEVNLELLFSFALNNPQRLNEIVYGNPSGNKSLTHKNSSHER